MTRPLLAAILSVALALPATVTPAAADARDVAKVLGGLAAIYLLKEAIDRNRERDRARAEAANRARVHQPRHYTHSHGRSGTHTHRLGIDHTRAHPRPRPQGDRRDVKLLPDRCFRRFETPRGSIDGYGARCMQNAVARPGLLPPQCIEQVRTDRGPRNLYSARCLRRDGWAPRTARR